MKVVNDLKMVFFIKEYLNFLSIFLDPTEEKKFVCDLVFEARKEPIKIVPVVSPLTILIQESSNEKNPFQEYLKNEAYVNL